MSDPARNGEYALIRWVLDAEVARDDSAAPRVILDIGANLGNWSRQTLDELVRRQLLSVTRIIAFEPAPEQNAHLRRRFAAEIVAGSVLVHETALGAAEAVAEFTVVGPDAGTNALSCGGNASGAQISVQVLTLDEVALQSDLGEISLVKIDTEGNDFNVLLGARGLLATRRIRVLQFEYNWRWIGFGHSLQDVFASLDSSAYALGRLTDTGVEFYDSWHPELEHYIETNYVAVRQDLVTTLPHRHLAFGPAETPISA